MSDDLFGDDIFLDAEEEGEGTPAAGGEGQNKTFIIAVAVLGGLLFIAIAAFIIWAAILNPRMEANRLSANDNILATNEAIIVAQNNTATAEAIPTSTLAPTNTPTATPQPTATATPVIKPTATPEPTAAGDAAGGTGDAGGAGDAAGSGAGVGSGTLTPTPKPSTTRLTPTPANTPKPTPTKAAGATAATGTTPDTGLGEVLLFVTAGLLVALIVFARKLRKA